MTNDKFMIADSMLAGSIDDHVVVEPKCDLGKEANENNKYDVIYSADFNVAPIPKVEYTSPPGVSMFQDGSDYHMAAATSKRKWGTNEVLARDLEKKEAIRVATEYASGHNVPVFLRVDFWNVMAVEKPDSWAPHFG